MVGVESGRGRKICVVSDALRSGVADLRPDYAGLAIGELKKRKFVPTMAGADLFARVRKNNGKHYISVNERAEGLVLYGRDVMGDSILRASEDLDENELVIIVNGRQEAIGVGRTRFAGKSLLKKGRIAVTTLLDAGLYLREEG